MNTITENDQYTISGTNPLKNFSGNEQKDAYTLEELQHFYFAHHPEKEECTLEEIKEMFRQIGGSVQLATKKGE